MYLRYQSVFQSSRIGLGLIWSVVRVTVNLKSTSVSSCVSASMWLIVWRIHIIESILVQYTSIVQWSETTTLQLALHHPDSLAVLASLQFMTYSNTLYHTDVSDSSCINLFFPQQISEMETTCTVLRLISEVSSCWRALENTGDRWYSGKYTLWCHSCMDMLQPDFKPLTGF